MDEAKEKISKEVVESYIFSTVRHDFGIYSERLLLRLVELAQREIHGLDFAHQGIARVGAGALVVERLFRHGVQFGVKIFFRHAGILDGQGDFYRFFQLRDGFNQLFHLFVVRFSRKPDFIGDLRVFVFGARIFVLRENRLLFGTIRRVVADDAGQQQRVGDAVRDVERRAQFVRHGMAQPQKRVGKRHARDCRRVVHFFARDRVVPTVFIRTGQIAEHQFDGLQRFGIRKIRRHARHVRLNGVHQRVDA